MAAILNVQELTSSTGDGVTKTSGVVRFKKASDTEVDTNNPISIPSSGDVCSFTKILRLKIDTPPTGSITNLQVYTGGVSLPTGVKVYYRVSSSYEAPQDVSNSTSRISKAITGDLFSKTADNPISLGNGPYLGTGLVGDHLVLCLQVDSSFEGLSLPIKPIIIGYDET